MTYTCLFSGNFFELSRRRKTVSYNVLLSYRITEIEEMIHNCATVNPDYLQDLKQDFEKFRSKLENGNFVKRISKVSTISAVLLLQVLTFLNTGSYTYSYTYFHNSNERWLLFFHKRNGFPIEPFFFWRTAVVECARIRWCIRVMVMILETRYYFLFIYAVRRDVTYCF